MNENKTAGRERRPAPLLILALALLFTLWGVRQAQGLLSTPPALEPDLTQREIAPADGPFPTRPEAATENGTGPEYGVVFMSSAEAAADEQQYANALSTGASTGPTWRSPRTSSTGRARTAWSGPTWSTASS